MFGLIMRFVVKANHFYNAKALVIILDLSLLNHGPSIPDLHFLNDNFILLASNWYLPKCFGGLKMFLN